MKKIKKKAKIAVIVLLVLLLLSASVFAGAWAMFGTKIKAANTVTKLQDGLYSMEYTGDYGLSGLLHRGGAATADDLADYLSEFLSNGFYKPDRTEAEHSYGCSTISAKTSNGSVIFGRNYDWENCTAMIIHTVPDDGYESVSTACLDFLGFGEDWLPEGIANQLMSLAAIYIPLDGMNEKGLVVADLVAGDKEETHQSTGKPDVTTTFAIRLMLDRAANVEEALALLEQYDMNSDIGTAHHYSIADATGRSVVVEYIGGKMTVTEAEVVTNHYLSDCDKKGTGSAQSHDRYEKLSDILVNTNRTLESSDVRDALKSVSQGSYHDEYEKTVWSIVYLHSEDALIAEFYFNEDYTSEYFLTLKAGKSNWIV